MEVITLYNYFKALKLTMPGTFPVDIPSPKQTSLVVAEINGLHSQQMHAIWGQAVRGIKP